MWQKKINGKSEFRFWLSNKRSLSKRVKNIAQFQVIQIKPAIIKFLKIERDKFHLPLSVFGYIIELEIMITQ